MSCLQPDRQIAHALKRIDVDAEPGELLAGLARHAPPLHEAKPIDGLGSEKHVLGHRQVGGDAQFLMHHGDAGCERVADRAEAGLAAVQHELAGEIRLGARDDLHQGALAGAVLADETMDLAGAKGEVEFPGAPRRHRKPS